MGHSHEHHYHYVPGEAPDDQRYRAAHKVTVVGAIINVFLAAAKIIVGFAANSQSLIADGVHSLSDLLSDAMVLVAAKHGNREADESHPYGHARIETAVTVGLGVLLLVVAGGIMIDAVARLFHPDELLMPGIWALVVAGISVLAKEALYHYTMHVARAIRSKLLRANAWHHRSDAISSVVVIIGIAGTMAGLPYLDSIAAVAVALMIAKVGWDLAWHSLSELVDTALDQEKVEQIRTLIMETDGVHALHMLRTRRMGSDALVDVHILVDPKVSVSEGHHISEAVRTRLIQEVEEVQDVLVHIDPEDDENTRPSISLPSRKALLERIRPHWEGIAEAAAIDRITLHYLDGRVTVEAGMPLSVVEDAEHARRLAAVLGQAADSLSEVAAIRVYFY